MPPRRKVLQYNLLMGGPSAFAAEEGMLLTGLERYFCGGCNTQVDIRGCLRSGSSVGICALNLTVDGESELLEWLTLFGPRPYKYDWRVFVDSGAFSEVSFTAGAPALVAPISEAGWKRRMELYERLALVGGARLHVAPDRVADQLHTLALLRRWRGELLRLWVLGARLIIPVQKGPHYTMATFRQVALEVLGLGEEALIWGIPSKKDATTAEELEAFASSLPPGAEVHLLGMGPHFPRYALTLAVLRHHRVAQVWSDLVRLRAVVGQGRPLTEATRAAEAEGLALPRETAILRVLMEDGHERVA